MELRRKLLRAETTSRRAAAGDAGRSGDGTGNGDGDRDGASADEAVETVLDWLEANRYLSTERFAESRVHAREGRFGDLRIRAELAQHGVALTAEASQALRLTEFDRAASVRERRFGEPPVDATARARQSRFLAARGFSPETIQKVFRRLQGR